MITLANIIAASDKIPVGTPAAINIASSATTATTPGDYEHDAGALFYVFQNYLPSGTTDRLMRRLMHDLAGNRFVSPEVRAAAAVLHAEYTRPA